MSLVLGVGLRSGTPYAELQELVTTILREQPDTISLVVTVEGKDREPAVRQLVDDLGAELRRLLAYDHRVFEGVSGVVTGLHLCRGNYKSKFTGTKPYE